MFLHPLDILFLSFLFALCVVVSFAFSFISSLFCRCISSIKQFLCCCFSYSSSFSLVTGKVGEDGTSLDLVATTRAGSGKKSSPYRKHMMTSNKKPPLVSSYQNSLPPPPGGVEGGGGGSLVVDSGGLVLSPISGLSATTVSGGYYDNSDVDLVDDSSFDNVDHTNSSSSGSIRNSLDKKQIKTPLPEISSCSTGSSSTSNSIQMEELINLDYESRPIAVSDNPDLYGYGKWALSSARSGDNSNKERDGLLTGVAGGSVGGCCSCCSCEGSCGVDERDGWAACIFYVTLLFVLGVALLSWAHNSSIFHHTGTRAKDADDTTDNVDSTSHDRLIVIVCYLFCSLSLVCIAVAALWFRLLILYADYLIHFVLIISILLFFSFACIMLMSGNIFASLFLLASGIMTSCYYRAVLPKIRFASAVISTAASAIKDNLIGIVSCAIGIQFMQYIWLMLWTMAVYGVSIFVFKNLKNRSNENTNDGGFIYSSANVLFTLLALFALNFGVQTIKYVLYTTVSGTVGIWCFQKDRPFPVRGSLYRSLTVQLGTICFAAFILDVVYILKLFVHYLRIENDERRNERRQGRDRRHSGSGEGSAIIESLRCVCLCCLEYLLNGMENVISFCNKYALCYASIYGTNFVDSGRCIGSLFERRGWGVLINDDLIGRVYFLLVLGFLCMMCAFWYIGGLLVMNFGGRILNNESISSNMVANLWVISLIVTILISYVIGNLMVSVLESAVSTIFVCFAENPDTFMKNQPENYKSLYTSWRRAYPDTLQLYVGGGNSINGGNR